MEACMLNLNKTGSILYIYMPLQPGLRKTHTGARKTVIRR